MRDFGLETIIRYVGDCRPQKVTRPVDTSAFKGSNDRLSRVDACKDEGHSDASSIKRVTSSSEDDCSVFSMKKGSLSAAAKSRI